MSRRPGLLYVCYLALDDPLVESQVVAYLRGLAADGRRVHLLTFETRRLSRAERRATRRRLGAAAITWHARRYHKAPSLPATVYDTIAGAVHSAWLLRRHRLGVLHARNHVPAAMWLLLAALWPAGRRPALLFDVRGLMAEEYRDAGRWVQDGLPFRLTKWVERRALARAAGVVVLTDRARRHLLGDAPTVPVAVIPCCVDLDTLAPAPGARERVRAELGLDPGTVVLVYVGKFGGWYLGPEMAAAFAALRAAEPDSHFLILTQSEPGPVWALLADQGVPAAAATVVSVPHGRVGEFLAAADLAIACIAPAPSKLASSPTKVGEYLAAGLPVLATAGVGDLDGLLGPDVGVLLPAAALARAAGGGSAGPLADAVAAARRLAADPATAPRCRRLAASALSLTEVGWPRYRALYAELARERARR